MTIKSPYLVKEPDLLFCSESSTFRPITLDYGDADMLPAGTPISADGKVANDLTAVGLLAYDAYKGYKEKEQIILTGHVLLDKAQEHCGLVYTAEAKTAMKSIIFVGDTELPGGHLLEEVDGFAEWDIIPLGTRRTSIWDMLNYSTTQNILDFYDYTISHAKNRKMGVEWNGKKYENVTVTEPTKETTRELYIGNASLVASGAADTGEPFAFKVSYYYNGGGIYEFSLHTTDEPGEATYRLYVLNPAKVLKVKEELIPDEIVRLEDILTNLHIFSYAIDFDDANNSGTLHGTTYTELRAALSDLDKIVLCSFSHESGASKALMTGHTLYDDYIQVSIGSAAYKIMPDGTVTPA